MNKTDWEALKALSEQEIEDRANADTENPPLPAELWQGAKVYIPSNFTA